MKISGKVVYLSAREMEVLRRAFTRSLQMEEYPQPTPEEVMAYNKIYPGTPEYNRHQRAIRLRNIGWLILLGAASTLAGSLITLAILMFIGIIG